MQFHSIFFVSNTFCVRIKPCLFFFHVAVLRQDVEHDTTVLSCQIILKTQTRKTLTEILQEMTAENIFKRNILSNIFFESLAWMLMEADGSWCALFIWTMEFLFYVALSIRILTATNIEKKPPHFKTIFLCCFVLWEHKVFGVFLFGMEWIITVEYWGQAQENLDQTQLQDVIPNAPE